MTDTALAQKFLQGNSAQRSAIIKTVTTDDNDLKEFVKAIRNQGYEPVFKGWDNVLQH